MAILQISRITNRKGYQENLPQLAGAEFGWSLDQRRLYIGNGNIDEGAPVVGNTEILTEFSNLLELSSTYTYKGEAGGYVVSTAENNEDVVRSMQERLDDTVSVRAFGAVGDGATDDTDAINRAFEQLFCNPTQQTTKIRRSLFFPAGTYKVTDTIKIPPYAKVYGEGLDSSIIEYSEPTMDATSIVIDGTYTILSVGELGNETDFTLIGADDNNAGTVFTATGVGTGTGTVKNAVPSTFVMQTSDNLHQVGDNLGNANQGVTPPIPEGIEMSSMSVCSTEKNSILQVNSLTKSSFSYMSFKGAMDVADLGDKETLNTAAIRIINTGNFVSTELTFNKCITKGTTVGLDINQRCKGVQFENGSLQLHYQGACIGGDDLSIVPLPEADTGPSGVNISRSIFDEICDAGILFGNARFNSSAFNVFYNVGNTFEEPPLTDSADPSAVITMFNGDNVSIGDLFERSDVDALKSPRIELNGTSAIAFDSTSAMFLGEYKRAVGLETTIPGNAGSADIFTLNDIESSSFQIDYSMARGSDVRMGTSTFVTHIVPDTPQTLPPEIHYIQFDDSYTQSRDLDANFSATIDLNDDDVPVGTTVSIDPGTMFPEDVIFKYSILRLK